MQQVLEQQQQQLVGAFRARSARAAIAIESSF